jgi:diaminohydroxyphosphoribosylaminopyrimidine deaminase/5-amino-6-(5-phosphoribosylamino)uracil reductase
MVRELNSEQLRVYMARCIQLASQAPDGLRKPHVGAIVLSSDLEPVGEGYRTFLDKTKLVLHAERMALDQAGDLAKEGYLITTLEPCIRLSKYQIFASCTEIIVERGIHTVVLGLTDANPQFSSYKGIQWLQDKGIKVRRYRALNHDICDKLMPHVFRMRTGCLEHNL